MNKKNLAYYQMLDLQNQKKGEDFVKLTYIFLMCFNYYKVIIAIFLF